MAHNNKSGARERAYKFESVKLVKRVYACNAKNLKATRARTSSGTRGVRLIGCRSLTMALSFAFSSIRLLLLVEAQLSILYHTIFADHYLFILFAVVSQGK